MKYQLYKLIWMSVRALEKYALEKLKYVGANNSPFYEEEYFKSNMGSRKAEK